MSVSTDNKRLSLSFHSLDPAMLSKIVALQTEIVEAGIDKPVVMQKIADAAYEITGADGALVEIIEGDEMVYAAVAPESIASTKGLRLKADASLSGLCVAENEILQCADSETDPRVDRAACRKVGLRAMTLVPLAAGGSVVGVLKVFTRKPGCLETEKLQALNLLARLLGAAMWNAARFDIEKHKLESVFSESPAAMAIMAGPDLRLERVNSKFQEVYGPQNFIGKGIFEARPELRDHPVAASLNHVYKTGDRFAAREAPLPAPLSDEGEGERYFDYNIVRLYDFKGQPYGLYTHSVEVTDRVRARRDTEAARLAAEKASQAKTYFLANVSHELRTPLSAIIGFADILKEQNVPDADRIQYLDKISRHGSALARIIDDLLDLTKLEYGNTSVKVSEVSLHSLVEDTIDLFREKVAAKKLSLLYQPKPEVPSLMLSDPIRLRQILINLIGNAVKFTDSGSIRVDVGCKTLAEGKLQCWISVVDTGIGVTDEQLAKLFRPFAQGDESMARRYGGFGLGLAISRKLSESLGGSIEFSANPDGVGSTFTSTFVSTVSSEQKLISSAETKRRQQAELPLSGHKILVADDSSDNLFLVKRLLTKNGAAVMVATNGAEAVQAALSMDPEAVLMDIQMPGLDGYEATRQLRARGFTKPIFALTAHAMAEDRERSADAGCDGHLTKPLNGPEVVRSLQAAITRR